MGFGSFADVDDNKVGEFFWSKTTTFTHGLNEWFDLSMSGGIPNANFYASTPLEAAHLSAANKGSMRHWAGGADDDERLLSTMAMGGGSGPSTYMLCDYLMYYPFIDCATGDDQFMENPVTLPERAADGVGVRMMLVSQSPTTSSSSGFYTTYKNQDGVEVEVTTTSSSALTSAGAGHILSGRAPAPFIRLSSATDRVLSVEKFRWAGASGIGGIAALVLVKPIATFTHYEAAWTSERQFHPRFPAIHKDAFLGLLRTNAGNTNASTVLGSITTIRS